MRTRALNAALTPAWQYVTTSSSARRPAADTIERSSAAGRVTGGSPERNAVHSRATPTWWRVQGWDNQRFEELLDVQRGQFDTDERMETSRRLVRIVADEVPILALVTPDRTALFDKTVMDTWHYTLGGGPVYPFLVNKLTFVDSESAGA